MRVSMKFKAVILLAALLVSAGLSFGQAQDIYVTYGADQSPALRVYNNGDESVSFVTVGVGGTNYVIIGSVTNSVIDTGTGTNDALGLVAASVAACTNSAGVKVLTVDQMCGLAADSTDAELLAATNTIAARSWGTALLWDTSTHLSYSLYYPSKTDGGLPGVRSLKRLMASPIGAGTCVLNVYADRTLIYAEPIALQYGLPAIINYAGLVTQTVESVVFERDFPLPVQDSVGLLVRVTRGTTATTGRMTSVLTLR